jgi:DNA helicase-2/ATP-dependent DNA helicase PcrA
MEQSLMQEGMERREISGARFFNRGAAPKHKNQGMYNQWSSFNSTSYNNADNYEDNDFSAPNKAPIQQEEPAQSAAAGGVQTGSRVKHGVFGEGKVIAISGSGESVKISVLFNNGAKRVFMLKYAPLEIL